MKPSIKFCLYIILKQVCKKAVVELYSRARQQDCQHSEGYSFNDCMIGHRNKIHYTLLILLKMQLIMLIIKYFIGLKRTECDSTCPYNTVSTSNNSVETYV